MRVLDTNEEIRKYVVNYQEASEVLEGYYQRLPNYEDANLTLDDSLSFGVRFLMSIEDIDFSNYKLILLDMLEVYYKYTNYLNQDIETLEETECIILDIENNLNDLIYCSVDNKELLKAVVEAYIKYNLLSADEKQKVEDYYSDPCKKKKLLKVSKNCQKLKHDED